MTKTVTLRLEDDKYSIFKEFASGDNRTLSNFIETATMRYIEENEFADEIEINEIKRDKALNQSIQRGINDFKNKRMKRIA